VERGPRTLTVLHARIRNGRGVRDKPLLAACRNAAIDAHARACQRHGGEQTALHSVGVAAHIGVRFPVTGICRSEIGRASA
jgi:hypothetical protein